ncbi:hypothetical protein ULMS_07050 [Patiriisocius marinistellae]|uniref:Calx-beta domain-containing protein n=1 Tax=Patiriisocius marinistellae TaxID=2494560 RepID=A0A5J4FSN1_9FLAO|nr:hypothetical protein [Patiriisocius marinistellae]GEQ85197.1 hypothetical protein ULMS_07050 [Patiriisocius marinistellae]
MKNLCLIILTLFISVISIAQNGINYKALIKDTDGNALVSQDIFVQFQILENGTTNVYQETHDAVTDANGIVVVNIGEGIVDSGNFLLIDWGLAAHFLNVQINTGAGFVDLGTTQFMSVPYANFAEDTRKGTLNDAYNKGGNGAGRIINAATGKVEIIGDGFEVKNVTNNSLLFVGGQNDVIGIKTNTPRGALDINSTNNGGFILPKATTNPETDIINIADPAASVPYGTLVYDAVNNCLSMYRGGSNEGWICVSEPAPPLEVDCNSNGLSDDFQEGAYLGSYTYTVTVINLSPVYASQPITFNYTDVVLSGSGLGTISPNATNIKVDGVTITNGESIIIPPNTSKTIAYRFAGDTGTAGSIINATWNNLGFTCTDTTTVLDPDLKLRSYSDLYEVTEGDTDAPYIINALIDGGNPSVDIQLNITHNGDTSDITPASLMVTIPSGSNTIPAVFTIIGDNIIEADEDFIFTIEIINGPPNLSFSNNGDTQNLTIIDDELPTLNIGYFDDDFENIYESNDLVGYRAFMENNFGYGKTIDTKGNGDQFSRVNFIDIDDMDFTLLSLNSLDLDIIWVNRFYSNFFPQNAAQVLLDWANNTDDGGVIIASLYNDNTDDLHQLFGHEFIETLSGNNIITTNSPYLSSGNFGSVPANTLVNYTGNKRSIALGTSNNPEVWALGSQLPHNDEYSIIIEDRGVFLSDYLFFEEMSNDGIVNTDKERLLAKIFAFAVSKIGQ